jgi:hypothetical protein
VARNLLFFLYRHNLNLVRSDAYHFQAHVPSRQYGKSYCRTWIAAYSSMARGKSTDTAPFELVAAFAGKRLHLR